MKRRLTAILLTAMTVLAVGSTAYAGRWHKDGQGWWYENDDGSYPAGGYETVEGRKYFFGKDGYMLHDTEGNTRPFTDVYNVIYDNDQTGSSVSSTVRSDSTNVVKDPQYELDKMAKVFYAPGWLWIGGNCYYFEGKTLYDFRSADDPDYYPYTGAFKLKNATTPDGYQVDEEGRWIVDGVVQHNEYGHVKMEMAEKYQGKTDDEIWEIMKDALLKLWAANYYNTDFKASGISSDNFISGNIGSGAARGSTWRATHNSLVSVHGTERDYIKISLSYSWDNLHNNVDSSQDLAFYGTTSAIIEKMIKIALGDDVGQEFFDYLRQHADALPLQDGKRTARNADGTPAMKYYCFDENGLAWVCDEAGNRSNQRFPEHDAMQEWWQQATETAKTRVYGDRIMEDSKIGVGNGIETLDLTNWQNRMTDYGKRFSISNDGVIEIYR